MDTFDRGLSHNFIDPGAVANGLTDLKTRWKCVCLFSIAAELTSTLSVPTVINSVALSSGKCGGCTLKTI